MKYSTQSWNPYKITDRGTHVWTWVLIYHLYACILISSQLKSAIIKTLLKHTYHMRVFGFKASHYTIAEKFQAKI